MGDTLVNRGWVLIGGGKPKEAEPFIREGLALRRRVLGDAHPDTAASFLRVADLLYAEGDYTGAEQAARESIAVYRRGLRHPPPPRLSFSPPTALWRVFLTKQPHRRA